MPSTRSACPDSWTCHHDCPMVRDNSGPHGFPCFRVLAAGPLSGVFPGDTWPDTMRTSHLLADAAPPATAPVAPGPSEHLDLTSAAQSVVTTLDAAAAGDLGTSHAVVATILWHRLVGGTEAEAIAYARALAADPDTRVHAHTAPF